MKSRAAHSVWLDDRNAIFRHGLRSALCERGFNVVGESASFEPEPDMKDVTILVFDFAGLPELQRRAVPDDVRLVGIATAESSAAVFQALEVGLCGLLVRAELTPDSLACCLSAVAMGTSAFPPGMLKHVLHELARGRRPGTCDDLSAREVSVLRLLASGSETRAIACNLNYSERTVKSIIHDVLVKLNCRTRAHAVALATKRGAI